MDGNQKLDVLLDAVAKIMQDLTEVKMEQKNMQKALFKIENDHGEKLKVIFDKLKQQDDQLEKINSKIDDLSSKVDKHDIKIQVIEGGKYKAN